jgi:hypothetical protein
MRGLFVALLIAAVVVDADACSCFSQEMRDKTGRETLELAQLAVFGRVVELMSDGSARLIVLESFKGPPKGSALTLMPSAGQCPAQSARLNEEVLVVSFHEPVTACEKYGQDHFLLDAFRSSPAK